MLLHSAPLSLKSSNLLLELGLQCHIARLQRSRQASSSAVELKSPRAPEDKNREHIPKPLSRPLGHNKPPRAGENSGVDPRTWRQRRDDFLNYDKHLERRKQLYVETRLVILPQTDKRNLPQNQSCCKAILPGMDKYAVS